MKIYWNIQYVKYFIYIETLHIYWNTPLKSWLFQASIRNCLNCAHNCEDHSSLDFALVLTTNMATWSRGCNPRKGNLTTCMCPSRMIEQSVAHMHEPEKAPFSIEWNWVLRNWVLRLPLDEMMCHCRHFVPGSNCFTYVEKDRVQWNENAMMGSGVGYPGVKTCGI